MLKRYTTCGFRKEGFWGFWGQWTFYIDGKKTDTWIWAPTYQKLLQCQQHTPIKIYHSQDTGLTWWMYKDCFYVEDEGCTREEVLILIEAYLKERELKLERIKFKIEQQEEPNRTPVREPIPDDVKMFVWQRDGGRCVKCGSQEKLEFDHIIPLSKGGNNTARNIQLLCEKCNRQKGNSLG